MPHEDEVAAIAAVPGKYEGQDDRVPAGRVGYPRELAWAATYLCSPYASYISGHSLVVDGANWQRRHTVQPAFTPIREQLGRGPFGDARARPMTTAQGADTMTDPRVTSATDTRPPLTDAERDLVRLEVDGPIAVITNNRPDRHNAMSDEMDRRLWEVLAEVHELPDLRAIVWRGEGSELLLGAGHHPDRSPDRGHLRPRVHRARPPADPDVPHHAVSDHLRAQGVGHRRARSSGRCCATCGWRPSAPA